MIFILQVHTHEETVLTTFKLFIVTKSIDIN
jgi:hypothetical protein